MLDAQAADIEFYLMKISRLESDLAATQSQLISARLRLRTAQDYQIKYELLLKQTDQQKQRQMLYEREEQEKIAELIRLKIQERDNYWTDRIAKSEKDQAERNSKEINKLNEEFASFKKKHEKCGNKFDEQDLLAFKNKKLQKEVESLQEKISQIKRQHQRSKQQEVRQIKESISTKSKEKQENERKIYREKIQSLQSIIINLEKDLLDAKTKADPTRQNQIDRLKSQLTSQIETNNQEIERLNVGFQAKGREIQQLLDQRYRNQQALIGQKKHLQSLIRELEDKLFEKEKEHEIEIINLRERMAKIRQDEVNQLKRQLIRIQQSFKQQRDSWQIVIADKDKQLERVKNKSDEDREKHKEDRTKQLKKIEELKQKLKEHEGEREAGQTEIMLKSLKDISAKQQDFNSYENGVTFLDRQLKKAITKIQQKNIEITKLLKQLNQLRKQSQNEINSLKQKGRKDKKYFTQKIAQLEQEIRQLNQHIRNKQRQSKKKQKDLQSKINLINKENVSLKDLVEEMQRDYTRAIQNKKAVQASYREERQKGLTSKSDLTMVKKQKWLEMERQKNELEVIFKEKQQQLKNKHEIQMEKLRHERDQLKSENEVLKGVAQSGKKQGEQNKQNKQSLYTEYHKKVATLNLQIALTKNIYDALVQAKSRKPKESRVSQFDRIDEDASNSQQNEEREREREREPAGMSHSDVHNLAMSFNPRSQ